MALGNAGSPPLLLSTQERDRLHDWVREGYPLETCGLLIGARGEHALRVVRAVRVKNIETERSHDRYLLDPAEHLAHERSACNEGLEIVGVWHSHPDHPARPSKTDLDAAWEGWSYLILRVDSGGAVEHRSWRLSAGSFVEEPVQLVT
jgi:proteasome lid subunit RPN8/RPN11